MAKDGAKAKRQARKVIKPRDTAAEWAERKKTALVKGPKRNELPKELRRPVGKLPWIPTEADAQKAYECARSGMLVKHIADALGIGLTTFYDKCVEYPQLEEAVKRGKTENLNVALDTLGHLVKEKQQIVATIFTMKAVHGYREEDSGLEHVEERRNTDAIRDRVQAALERIRGTK